VFPPPFALLTISDVPLIWRGAGISSKLKGRDENSPSLFRFLSLPQSGFWLIASFVDSSLQGRSPRRHLVRYFCHGRWFFNSLAPRQRVFILLATAAPPRELSVPSQGPYGRFQNASSSFHLSLPLLPLCLFLPCGRPTPFLPRLFFFFCRRVFQEHLKDSFSL